MHSLLVGVGIAAVFWALVQGFVPLAIETFISVPENDAGNRLKGITHYKRVFTKVSIGILAAILIATVVGIVLELK